MKALIVHAHPESRSFVVAMRDTAKRVLPAKGYEVMLSDLYVDRFDPVAKAEDFTSQVGADYLVYAKEQRNAVASGTLRDDIEREFVKLQQADLLVLTFPIFWFSVPAILKGWIDRVFLSGPIYGGRRFYDRGGMAGRRALVGASLGGRDYMFHPDSVHGDLKTMMRHLLQGTLGYVGFDVVDPFFAYHVPYVDSEARQKMLSDWESHLVDIETRPVLPMPSLSDFDDKMRPLASRPKA